jgi:hypothetical protein
LDTEFKQDLTKIFKSLQNSTKTILWFGAPRQHFRYQVNDIDTDGVFHYRKSTDVYSFCGNSIRYPFGDRKFDPRNQYAFEVATSLGLKASWINWKYLDVGRCQTNPRKKAQVWFFPMSEFTSPFFRNHETYTPDISESTKTEDCTHSCWAPNLYEPMWDALFLVLSANGVCTPQSILKPRFASYASFGDEIAVNNPSFVPAKFIELPHDAVKTNKEFFSTQLSEILQRRFYGR